MVDSLLIAVDGSERATEAAELAVELASTVEASLEAIFVAERRPVYTKQGGSILAQDAVVEEEIDYGQQVLDEVESLAADAEVPFEGTVRTGMPATVISEFAEERDVDAIVVGTAGRQGVVERFVGNTAERVLRASPVTVIAVR